MIPPDHRPSRVGSGQHLDRVRQRAGIGRSKAKASLHLAPSEAASHSRSTQGVGHSQTSLSAPLTTAPTALAGPPAIHKSCMQQEAVEMCGPAKQPEAAEQQYFLILIFLIWDIWVAPGCVSRAHLCWKPRDRPVAQQCDPAPRAGFTRTSGDLSPQSRERKTESLIITTLTFNLFLFHILQ